MAAVMENHFKTLEITENASADGVRQAYKRLAKVWHPDKNTAEGSEEKFKAILKSYTYLQSDDRRETHARLLKRAREAPNHATHTTKPSSSPSENVPKSHTRAKAEEQASSGTGSYNSHSKSTKSKPTYWWDTFKAKHPEFNSNKGKDSRSQSRDGTTSTGKKSQPKSRSGTKANTRQFNSFPMSGFMFGDPFDDILFDIFMVAPDRPTPKPKSTNDPFGNKLPKDVGPDLYDWKSATKSPGQQPDYQDFTSGDSEFTCHYCGLMMTMEMLRKHEPRCMKLGGKKKPSNYEFEEEEHVNGAYPSTPPPFNSQQAGPRKIKCRWCGEAFSKKVIAEHISRCRQDIENAGFSRKGSGAKPDWNFDTEVPQNNADFIFKERPSTAHCRPRRISVFDDPTGFQNDLASSGIPGATLPDGGCNKCRLVYGKNAPFICSHNVASNFWL